MPGGGSPLLLRLRRRGSTEPTFEITGAARGLTPEGVIDRVRTSDGQIDVRLVLHDGTTGRARLAAADWEWLELRRGDIVALRRACPPDQRVTQDSGVRASLATGAGRRALARSASVTPSSTARTFVRSAIHTSCSEPAWPG